MKKVLIIAEAGVNHNGNINTAKKLIDVAVEAKVDLVKFQTFKADSIVSPQAKKADYQIKNTKDRDATQYEMLKKLELSHQDHVELIDYCKGKGIDFFSTAFDVAGIDYLESLNFPIFKVPSGEITNYPYLKAIALKSKPIILSTGMCNLTDIEQAINTLMKYGTLRSDITVLHCNTEYPTPMKDVNLKAMNTIGQAFGVKVGYSDHTLGIEVPIAAVALGATVIEKHFTLDRNFPGPDHRASLEPNELKAMVLAIRNIESALSGNGIKEASESEVKNKSIARKSIHLKNSVTKGTLITEDDLIPLRPGDGISTMKYDEVIGRVVNKDVNAFHKLIWNDLI
ncbi:MULTISPECIES: N-acetylneuraminate synthase [unclassified Polaribacter]|uniref:N-acetylneuraminate synthase n=1 Tax=unclassified Polaribacter TaxID=196858 RepID=UPI0011BD79A4|nr:MULTISPECIES: N-acetylneuraminate synthase [unclassified Polaribacter]TXD49011.1 N-acetylneuraminate synthase [Polaribacter sp. IC063]TXD57190.1 N-acetylneuraminate synthase [Polaribacter sp. IC066]